jgi:hypothetical protein
MNKGKFTKGVLSILNPDGRENRKTSEIVTKYMVSSDSFCARVCTGMLAHLETLLAFQL